MVSTICKVGLRLISPINCSTPVHRVVCPETGEILNFLQFDPSDSSQVILIEEDGEQVRIPVDLLVCSTCKQQVVGCGDPGDYQGLPILLCQSYLKERRSKPVYTSETLSDIQNILDKIPSPTKLSGKFRELKCVCGGDIHWLRNLEVFNNLVYFECRGCGKRSLSYFGIPLH